VPYLFYPKLTQNCPNIDHCPHLGGAALGSVVLSANANDEWLQSLLRQIDALREEGETKSGKIRELEERNEQLERELKAERQKQFKATTKVEEEEQAPSDPEKAKPKKRGAPMGHPGWFRPTPTHIDRTIFVPAPKRCPHCKAVVRARPDLSPHDHPQEDFIDGQPMTTCYRHEAGRCTNRKCRRWVQQAGEGEILRAKIGPEMRARGLFLRLDIGLPHRKVVSAVKGLDSLSFTPAALLGFEKQAAKKAAPLAHDVAKKLRACEVNHADETYYRINRGFSVELGIPSVPTLESIRSFIPLPDRWPISDTWAYHDWHQSGNGAVAPYMAHMDTEFGAPASLEDFERKAQMLDYAGHRAIFEGFAAYLWQPNSGRMIWMTQPAWPSMEWNFLSWDYDTQSSFYGTQKACEPVHAQLDLTSNAVDLINLGEARTFKVRTHLMSLDGKTLSDQTYPVLAAANDRTSVSRLDLDQLAAGHTILVELQVSDAADAPVSDNFYWWAKDEASLRELNGLPQAALSASATVAVANGERKATVKIKNSGSSPALMIKLTLQEHDPARSPSTEN